jgi:predicted GH43/DUF377 family glycosyl hydrolase
LSIPVTRTSVVLYPDQTRVLIRPFRPASQQQTRNIVARVLRMSEREVAAKLEVVLVEFRSRHYRLREYLLGRFDQLRSYLPVEANLSEKQQLLLGAYFTQEFALESAALFNPSMVWHPDQSGLEPGARRFILSLRAVGEGHISSLTFRAGVVDGEGLISMAPAAKLATAADRTRDPSYDRGLFERKLLELGLRNAFSLQVMGGLGEAFSWSDLLARLALVQRDYRARSQPDLASESGIRALAESNYEVSYPADLDLSECVLFPYSPAESNGIEDARFVEFQHEDGRSMYYATYTAYDGKVILPQFLETKDFLRFKLNTLNGPEAANKGMALFPRMIDGRYAMISRQDNENLYLMRSDNLHFWNEKQLLLQPTRDWEFVQLGNCGSPIETEAGWLALTHGVGPMRKYCIGAILLDRADPTRVLGCLREPLLSPAEYERSGYVPNVVYSCGAQVHAGNLIIPYARSDYASTFAVVRLEELLDELRS